MYSCMVFTVSTYGAQPQFPDLWIRSGRHRIQYNRIVWISALAGSSALQFICMRMFRTYYVNSADNTSIENVSNLKFKQKKNESSFDLEFGQL